tara:strand:- start:524 stop:1630 length:1107 start_codon:yes stop_codon:yes gene_type:complete
MKWIWERPNWPNFTFDASVFLHLEREFHRNTGLILGALSSVSNNDAAELKVTLLSNEALDTSKIEGEILDRESVQSSIRGQLGLQTDGRRSGPKETGASRMMVDLYKSYSEPLDQKRLFTWHQMIMNGRIDLDIVGGFRVHEDPMQIVSGRLDLPQVFYEAPPSHKVPKEMENYLVWFNRAFSEGMPTLIHAGLAHLYFELIHPFEDGNGRIGRAIAEKALAMGAKHSLITSLSSTIERKKKAYYQALERANGSLEVTDWLVYFSEEVLEAQTNVQKLILFIVEKARYFEHFRNKLNERQSKVALRLFQEGPEGFKGGLSAQNYIRITKTSAATATRDLAEMVTLGALKKTGKLRHTRYYLAMVEISH